MTHRQCFDAQLGPGRLIENEDHVYADAHEDAQLQRQNQTGEKGSQTGYEIGFCWQQNHIHLATNFFLYIIYF